MGIVLSAMVLSTSSVQAQSSSSRNYEPPTIQMLRGFFDWCKQSLTFDLYELTKTDQARAVQMDGLTVKLDEGRYQRTYSGKRSKATWVTTAVRFNPNTKERIRGTCKIRHAPKRPTSSRFPRNMKLTDIYPETDAFFAEIKANAAGTHETFNGFTLHVECFENQPLGTLLLWFEAEDGFRINVELLDREVMEC
jgi:hypothetical protein